MATKKKCNHEWRYLGGDDFSSYFYCIHCLAEAVRCDRHGEYTISERKEVK